MKVIFFTILFMVITSNAIGDECTPSFNKTIEYVKYAEIPKAVCIWEKLAENHPISAYNLAVGYLRFAIEKKDIGEKWLQFAKDKKLPKEYFEDFNFRDNDGNVIWQKIDFQEGLDDLARQIFITLKRDFIKDYFIFWVIGRGNYDFNKINESMKRENIRNITGDINFSSSWIDVNRDGKDELLVIFENIGFCGSGGCNTHWFMKKNNKWIEFNKTWGDYNPFYYSVDDSGKIIGFINYDKYTWNNFGGLSFDLILSQENTNQDITKFPNYIICDKAWYDGQWTDDEDLIPLVWEAEYRELDCKKLGF